MTIVPIQILRACAAAMVVVHHGLHEAAALNLAGSGAEAVARLPWWAGVDVFFVISGFIIVQASGPRYDAPGGRRRFLVHRVARVVPLYWLVTALYLAVALAAPSSLGDAGAAARDPGYVAASFLFWPALRPDGTPQPLYGLGWTLNCEMVFYGLFALGLGHGRRVAVAWIVGFLGLLTAAGALVPLSGLPLAFWSNPVVLEFALGAGLGLARSEGLRLPSPARLVLAVAGIGLLFLQAGGADPEGFARPLGFGLPAAMLVAAAAFGSAHEKRDPAPVRWLAAIGDASYALYLVHPFVLRAAREGVLRLGLAPWLGTLGVLCLMLALSVGAALLVFRFVERPATRRLRVLLDPVPSPAGAPAKSV
ncbi:acyltransferase family protein [Methylobacterium trifolii]|uniref:acyltransferase family protein n=1 Tax=Methylobacterium trifolii TaxID=1003092 RepID=UPI001EE02A16|nr:acyltransferase [Methylobacterium trifolii]